MQSQIKNNNQFNQPNQSIPVIFANNLCAYLDNPTSENGSHMLNIRHFPQQCSGETRDSKRCRNTLKVEVAYDSAETNPPKIFCHAHSHQDRNRDPNLNLVIQEVFQLQHIKHRCVGIGTDMPELPNAVTTAYQSLDYSDVIPTPVPQAIDRVGPNSLHGVDCDKCLYIDPHTMINIYYVRESGRIYRTQVSAATQIDDMVQSYKTKVAEDLAVVGEDQCGVCLETLPLWNLGCGESHSFCQTCIARLACKNAVCPFCRKDIQCLTRMATNFGKLDRIQVDSPEYEVCNEEINPECIYDDIAFKIKIERAKFRYPDMCFSAKQEVEYRIIALLLEKKLVFERSQYEDRVYVRTRLFGELLNARLDQRDISLIQDLVEYSLECGLDSMDQLIQSIEPID